MATTDTPKPSSRRIAWASACALLCAALILLVAVLPAEYSIDPLGVGRALGLTALGERVAQLAGRCSLRFNTLAWWPKPARPRLLAAVAPEAGSLQPLRDGLAEGLDQLGVPFDHRPLRPHITLMRLPRGEPVDAELLAALPLPSFDIELPVSELLLYRSEASPAGRRYTPIWRRELRA